MRALLSPRATNWQPSCHCQEVTIGTGSIVPKCHPQPAPPLRMLRGHNVLPDPWVLQDTRVPVMLTQVSTARMPRPSTQHKAGAASLGPQAPLAAACTEGSQR